MNVFVAHAPNDTRTANKLALDLMKRGIEVWIDIADTYNQETDAAERELESTDALHKADVVLVILSPAAMVNPDLMARVEMASQHQRPMYKLVRQEVALVEVFKEKLSDVPSFSIGRSDYEEGLAALLRSLGFDPDVIVNDIISPLEADEWLPGVWHVKFYNPSQRLSGSAEYEFGRDKSAEAEIQIREGEDFWINMHMVGKWDLYGTKFVVQGESKMAMFIQDAPLPKNLPYVLSLEIVEFVRGRFKAFSTAGERIIFYRKTDQPEGNH